MPTAPTGPATRAHRRTSLAACRLQDQGLKHGPRPSAIVSNFPQPAVLRLLPTRETLARQHARWPRRISLRDGAQRDRACVATGGLHTFVRTQQRVVERAHSNVARKTKGWLEHKIRHAVGTRKAYSQFRRHAQSPECWTRNFVSSGIILRPPAGAGGKISQRRDRVSCRHLQDFQRKSPAETELRLWMTRWRRDVVSSVRHDQNLPASEVAATKPL